MDWSFFPSKPLYHVLKCSQIHLLLLIFSFKIHIIFDKVSPCNTGWPQIYYVDQTGL